MRTFATVLAVLALVATAHAFVDFTATAPNEQRQVLANGNIRLAREHHQFFPEHGTYFKVKYDAHYNPKWNFISLHEHADFMADVTCPAADTITVRNPQPSILKALRQQDEFNVVTAHARFHCGNVGIFRHVVSFELDEVNSILKIQTAQASYEHVFENLDYEMETNHMPARRTDSEVTFVHATAEHAAEREMKTLFLKKLWNGAKKAVSSVGRAATGIINKAKDVVKKVVSVVKSAADIVKGLLTGAYTFDKQWTLFKYNYNGNVAKQIKAWNTQGELKLSASFDFNSFVKLRIQIKSYKLIDLQAFIQATAEAGVRAEITASTDAKIATKRLAEFSFAPITFMIGPIPVILTPKIPLDLDAGVNVDAKVNCAFMLSAKGSVKLGFQYTQAKGFQGINERKFTWAKDFNPREFSLEVGANAMISANPVLNINFIGGPYARLAISGEVTLQVNGQCMLFLSISVQPIIGIGAKIDISLAGMKIFAKDWGPMNILSTKIPILSYCMPKKVKASNAETQEGSQEEEQADQTEQTEENTEGGGEGHRFEILSATNPSNPGNKAIIITHPKVISANYSSRTWFGKIPCPNSDIQRFSIEMGPSDNTSTNFIVTFNKNVSSIDENGMIAYGSSNVQAIYTIPGMLRVDTPTDASLLPGSANNTFGTYTSESNETMNVKIPQSIKISVSSKSTDDLSVFAPEFCTWINVVSTPITNDTSTASFAGVLNVPDESNNFLNKFNGAALYATVGAAVALVASIAIVAFVVLQKKRESAMSLELSAGVATSGPVRVEARAAAL